jgi:hypothetical protein
MKNTDKVLAGKPEKRHHLGDLGRDKKIIISEELECKY